jgi:hypothetical protein
MKSEVEKKRLCFYVIMQILSNFGSCYLFAICVMKSAFPLHVLNFRKEKNNIFFVILPCFFKIKYDS